MLHEGSVGSEEELLARARALGGFKLGELARAAGPSTLLPADPARAKGKIGTLIERALGLAPSSRAEPDVAHLGIEIKTLPVDERGRPTETTFVCTAACEAEEADWGRAHVRRKLARVLWVPIETDRPIEERRVGAAFLWSPDRELEETLERDWHELRERLAITPDHVSARHGRALQLRPKARNGAIRITGADADGTPLRVLPRAYYLRRWVTAHALERADLWT